MEPIHGLCKSGMALIANSKLSSLLLLLFSLLLWTSSLLCLCFVVVEVSIVSVFVITATNDCYVSVVVLY